MTIATAVRYARRAALWLACVPAISCSHPEAHLAIDTHERHQTMAGWEVTARAWEYDKVNDRFDGSWVPERERLAAMLVDDAGIDRIRLEIKSGMENPVDYWALFVAGKIGYREYKDHFYEKINDNADPTTLNPEGIQFSDLDWHVENIVLPVKQRLKARGRHLRLNLAYVDFKWTALSGTLSHAGEPAEYAELVAAAFSHLKEKYGLVPDSLEIIIEPDNTRDWSGVAIGTAIVAASSRLDAAGFPNVEIIAPSTAKAQRALAYFKDIRSVPGAAQRMTTLAYHRYDGAPDALDLNEMRDAARAARIKTAMLEYVDGSVSDLLTDLSEGDTTAWQKYGIATMQRADGTIPPGWLITGREVPGARRDLRLAPMARSLGLLFGTVDQGSVRVSARANSEDLGAAAFLTPGHKLVVAIHPQGDMPLTISGLRQGRYRVNSATAAGEARSTIVVVNGLLKMPVADGTTYILTEL